MLEPNTPALVLAPMEGVTDAPMRALQGSFGAFTYAVSEFLRVSTHRLPAKVFARDIPEFRNGGLTSTGLLVHVQILGGDPDLMAASALSALKAGAQAIDINFGCPAPTVNRHDGGASLLRYPDRIYSIVSAVRSAVPKSIPVSAKLRLGWDSIDDIHHNAEMAAKAGASWLTIHARTKAQGYQPPVFWKPIGEVQRALGLPVIANGDIWTLDDFRRCQDETGCLHYMIGRGALADPSLPIQIARELGITKRTQAPTDWVALLQYFVDLNVEHYGPFNSRSLLRIKQWLKLASKFGDFPYFDDLKQTQTLDEFFEELTKRTQEEAPVQVRAA